MYLYRRLTDNKPVVIKKIPLESITKDENEVRQGAGFFFQWVASPGLNQSNLFKHSLILSRFLLLQLTKNEVRVLSMLQHPNIIEYYDNYLDSNTMMIVMEYAPGGNLYDYLRSRGEGNLLQEEVSQFVNLQCMLYM